MGSVKDLLLIETACENRAGLANFVFSDRYSVFDWGEMPDHIANKGRSLATMAAFNFEELERQGLRTHYQGMVNAKGELVRFGALKQGGSETMQVSLGRVYAPVAREIWREDGVELSYDYSFFEANRGLVNNYLIGLEIIFRNGLPLGSSLFKRFDRLGSIGDPKERDRQRRKLLREIGLREEPRPGQMLPRPLMSYTTKLEPGDRSLNLQEAWRISGLSRRDFRVLRELALKVNRIVTERAERAGFVHFDGKIEALWDQGVVICDVVGTFDENRFAFQGAQVSKEVVRQWYKRHQPEFAAACEEWKKTGSGWQKRCPVKPRRLPREFATLVSQMYMAGCNRYTGRKLFRAPELEAVMDRLQAYSA
jgi:phosphoribosylaminoimidazole-succinocarboxamide synthase